MFLAKPKKKGDGGGETKESLLDYVMWDCVI